MAGAAAIIKVALAINPAAMVRYFFHEGFSLGDGSIQSRIALRSHPAWVTTVTRHFIDQKSRLVKHFLV
ncbi:hypothetical protein ACFQAT_21645 [Undibacterium arcticum]|uniref:hypothetical protein n=1 Tax=Undibacterium arcticum TaxID=1762892 RepID=UPI00361EF812